MNGLKKFLIWTFKNEVKTALLVYKWLGFRSFAEKAEKEIDETIEAHANNEDTPQAKRLQTGVRWGFWILLIIGILAIILKIKQLFK